MTEPPSVSLLTSTLCDIVARGGETYDQRDRGELSGLPS
jgi:hypothetical protein